MLPLLRLGRGETTPMLFLKLNMSSLGGGDSGLDNGYPELGEGIGGGDSPEEDSPEDNLGTDNGSAYLPAECQAAIDATNQKYNDMKEVWDNYISNLRNGTNLNQLQHTLQHVQNIGQEHLAKHNALKLTL